MNNTLEAMIMTEGDPCPGGVRRQSKVWSYAIVKLDINEIIFI